MNIDKKILVSDYDKTFYLNDEDVEINKIAINKFREKGNLFVIATGRSYYDIQKEINKYKINYDYLIINHGASILSGKDEIVYNFPIKNEIISKIRNNLEIDIPNMKFHLENDTYSTSTNKYFCCKEKVSRLDFSNKDLTKINIKLDSEETANKINNIMNDKYSENINCYKVSKDIIEIIAKEINKCKAIKLLADYYNLDNKFIYTIGDGYSDIEMIKNFNGYAMKDSVEELKKVAKKEFESVSLLINELLEDNQDE